MTMQHSQWVATDLGSTDFVVQQNRFGRGVYAKVPVKRGGILAVVTGQRVHQRTRMSIQVDWTTHVELGPPWDFINHSCDPNCYLAIRCGSVSIEIVTIRDLEPGEELFLDYDLFEYEIHHFPSACLCGSPTCRGTVRGYRFLSSDMRAACTAFVADYLKTGFTGADQTSQMLDSSGPETDFDPGEAGMIPVRGTAAGTQKA
jgi:uncharacterized protein